jgi:hypothetical protein
LVAPTVTMSADVGSAGASTATAATAVNPFQYIMIRFSLVVIAQ